MPPRVAVIGAGVAGIFAVKTCLEEGLQPTCYEMSGNIGGLWRYQETPEEGRASVMWSTVFNSSKEISSPSEFPPPSTMAVYPDHWTVIEFIDKIADHFGVRPYIRLNRKVVWVAPKEGQKWDVTTRETGKENPKEETQEFDAVIVCTGHHGVPLIPEFPGLQEKFQGRVLHSHAYRHPKGFENSSVVVVGCGDSACDIATELSRLCRKVYLSVRSGAWVLPRVGPYGIPIDMFYLNRAINWCFDVFPSWLYKSIVEWILNFYFDHKLYQMKPPHRIFDQTPTLNDSLASRIVSGRIIVKGDIQEFVEKGVIFKEDKEITPVDVAILATGYKMVFPFLPENIVVAPNNINICYKFTFPPDYPTLAFLGLFQPIGPGIPVGELQGRWIAAVLSGRCKLPPKEEMKEITKRDLEKRLKKYGTNPAHANHLDLINGMDEYATMLGVKPCLWRMLFTDPKLFFYCFLGPCTGYQFRLEGPHSWPGARDAILTSGQRIKAALKTRHHSPQRSSSTKLYSLLKIPLMFFMFIILLIFVVL